MRPGTRIGIALGVCCVLAGGTRLDAGGFVIKKEDVPKTIQKLKTGSAKEKAAAADALGNRGALRATDVQDAIDPLKNALMSETDAKVRAAAAGALGKIAPEPKETVKLLLKALQSDKEAEVKIAAMTAIGQMPADAGPAVPELRKIAQDKDDKKLSGVARNVLKLISKK